MTIPVWIENSFHYMINTLYSYLPQDLPSLDRLKSCKIISHRGEHDNISIFENTIPAFDAACEAGLWGIEFDLRWTKDLIPIVIHDDDCTRVFGKDFKINQMNWSELNSKIPLIPNFENIIKKFGKKIHLMIEIKNENYPDLKKQKIILKNLLTRLVPVKDFHILTLNPSMFDKVDFLTRKCFLPVAELNTSKLSEIALKEGWAGVAGHYYFLKDHLIVRHHSQNQVLGTGFVSSIPCLFRELNRGVDFIFTNSGKDLKDQISQQIERSY